MTYRPDFKGTASAQPKIVSPFPEEAAPEPTQYNWSEIMIISVFIAAAGAAFFWFLHKQSETKTGPAVIITQGHGVDEANLMNMDQTLKIMVDRMSAK